MNMRLGQISPPRTGITFRYNEAVAWLAAAEPIAAVSPSCDLPIVGLMREFVGRAREAKNEVGATLELTPADMAGLDAFDQCSRSIDTRRLVEAKEAADAMAATKRRTVAIGLAGAAVAILGIGYLISKA